MDVRRWRSGHHVAKNVNHWRHEADTWTDKQMEDRLVLVEALQRGDKREYATDSGLNGNRKRRKSARRGIRRALMIERL